MGGPPARPERRARRWIITTSGASLRAAAANSRGSPGLETDEKPDQLVATGDPTTNQIMMGTVSRASTQPAGFACRERSIRPAHRTKQMRSSSPHVGHSLPVVLRNEQDGSPSCVCVPRSRAGPAPASSPGPAAPRIPAAAGRKHAADRPTQRIMPPTALLVHGWPPAQKDVQRDRARRQGPWKGTRTLTESLKPDKMNLVQYCQWSVGSCPWSPGRRSYTQRGPD